MDEDSELVRVTDGVEVRQAVIVTSVVCEVRGGDDTQVGLLHSLQDETPGDPVERTTVEWPGRQEGHTWVDPIAYAWGRCNPRHKLPKTFPILQLGRGKHPR